MAAEIPSDTTAAVAHAPVSMESDRRRQGTQMHLSTNVDIASQSRPAGRVPGETFGQRVGRILKRHLHFVGPGIMSSVAFMDPGNWSTDLKAGAEFGYPLLSVILMSSLVGIFLQVLAVRLGAVTGFDLARSTRLWLLPEEKEAMDREREVEVSKGHLSQPIRRRPWKKCRLVLLWILYFVAEGAVICTELAELVGSAIALNLLFPGLPLWAGTLVTSVDVFLILLVYREGGSMRAFEVLIALLVFCVMGCFIVLLARIDANWGDVFHGYIPSSTLVQADALYIAVGIVGATVMPHALYNASQWATIDRLEFVPPNNQEPRKSTDTEAEHPKGKRRAGLEHQPTTPDHPKYLPAPLARLRARAHGYMARLPSASLGGPRIPSPEGRDVHYKVSISNIRIHLAHATVDIVLSLIAFAMVVNSAILIVAAAAFYYGPEKRQVGDLFEAFELLRTTVGKSSAILFAVALLAAGQSASLTVTLAGQLVSEGFIRWTTNAFWRRVLTRSIALVPSLAVAAGVGRGGLDRMLVASQVALSMALPFVLLPLLVLTGQRAWMTVHEEPDTTFTRLTASKTNAPQSKLDLEAKDDQKQSSSDIKVDVATPSENVTVQLMPVIAGTSSALATPAAEQAVTTRSDETDEEEGVKVGRFANHWTVVVLAWLIYAVIVLCDGFVVVTSAMGKS